MKYNNIFLGLGVIALALTACSEDVEYTPASPVQVPPVYFNMNDETGIDLEEDSKDFIIPVYRGTTTEAAKANVNVTVKTADGSPIPAGTFSIGKYVEVDDPDTEGGKKQVFEKTTDFDGDKATVEVEFAKGQGESDIVFDFGSVNNLVSTLDYEFAFTVAGEDSPYFITKIDYTVAYVPWQTLDEPAIIQEYALLAPAVGGGELEWEVTVQEHPLKPGFFRMAHPYKDSPYSQFYVLPDNDLNYLYINATSPSEVYFSDSKGKPVVMYNTGIQNFTDTEGPVHFACAYSAYLLQTDIKPDYLTETISWKNFDTYAGTYEKGRVKFGANLIVFIPGVDGYWRSKSWTLTLPNAPEEWVDMGEATYTDGFIGEYFLDQAYTYKVRIQQHESEAGKYRLIAPYALGTWPSDIAVSWDKQFNMVIDASDPDFVIVEAQEVFEDADGSLLVANAGYAFQFMTKEPATKDEIIAEGFNDTMKDGVITISHPLLDVGNDNWKLLWEEARWKTPVKIVLPTEEEQAQTAAKKLSKRNTKISEPAKIRR